MARRAEALCPQTALTEWPVATCAPPPLLERLPSALPTRALCAATAVRSRPAMQTPQSPASALPPARPPKIQNATSCLRCRRPPRRGNQRRVPGSPTRASPLRWLIVETSLGDMTLDLHVNLCPTGLGASSSFTRKILREIPVHGRKRLEICRKKNRENRNCKS